MTRNRFMLWLGAALLALLPGCTGQMVATAAGPMPDYCTTGASNPAGGAIIGSLLGAALGAAAGGGRGAALGAAIGGGIGAMTGAQMDANCRNVAMQNFTQMMAQQAAAERAAMAQGQAAVQPANYLTYDFDAPSPVQGQPPVHHRLVQTSHFTNPANGLTCNDVNVLSFADQSSTVTGTKRVCIGANGAPV